MNTKSTNQSDHYGQIDPAGNDPHEIGFFQSLLPYLILIGYDFRDKFRNFFLSVFGDPLVQFFTAYQHFANFGLDGRPVEKADVSGASSVSILPVTVELQPPSLTEKVVPPQSKPGIPLIAQSFRIGYMILLAAGYGIGKTFLAIYAVLRAFQENHITSAVIFSLEDRDGKQRPRFEEMLKGYDFTLISPQEFASRKTETEQNRRWVSGIEADYRFKNPVFSKFMGIYKEILRETGATLKDKKPVKLITFLSMVDNLMEEGVRFFVLDSLTKIFENTNSISRNLMEAFLAIFQENGATFIVIHHLNGEGKFYGTDLISADFDEAYIMKNTGFKNKLNDFLQVKVDKKRYEDEPDFWIKRTRISDHVARHEVLYDLPPCSRQPSTVKERIKKALAPFNSDIVNLEDLLQQLGAGVNSRTVTNNLIELEKDGFLEKVNPNRWGKIRILK
jgi:hypothetical protein